MSSFHLYISFHLTLWVACVPLESPSGYNMYLFNLHIANHILIKKIEAESGPFSNNCYCNIGDLMSTLGLIYCSRNRSWKWTVIVTTAIVTSWISSQPGYQFDILQSQQKLKVDLYSNNCYCNIVDLMSVIGLIYCSRNRSWKWTFIVTTAIITSWISSQPSVWYIAVATEAESGPL